jgi:hypothetical protein
MQTVKFLKTKSYAGVVQKAGSSIPMREDHAGLLQTLGVVVIEDSPVVKLRITGRPQSIPMAPPAVMTTQNTGALMNIQEAKAPGPDNLTAESANQTGQAADDEQRSEGETADTKPSTRRAGSRRRKEEPEANENGNEI